MATSTEIPSGITHRGGQDSASDLEELRNQIKVLSKKMEQQRKECIDLDRIVREFKAPENTMELYRRVLFSVEFIFGICLMTFALFVSLRSETNLQAQRLRSGLADTMPGILYFFAEFTIYERTFAVCVPQGSRFFAQIRAILGTLTLGLIVCITALAKST